MFAQCDLYTRSPDVCPGLYNATKERTITHAKTLQILNLVLTYIQIRICGSWTTLCSNTLKTTTGNPAYLELLGLFGPHNCFYKVLCFTENDDASTPHSQGIDSVRWAAGSIVKDLYQNKDLL